MSHRLEQSLGQKSDSRRTSLQTRLVLFMLLISLTPLILISVRDILQTQQALLNGAEISLRSSAEQTANSLDSFIKSARDSVRTEAQLSDFANYLALPPFQRAGTVEEARVRELLAKLSSKDTANIISYALLDSNGINVLDTVRENIGTDESGRDYFTTTTFTRLPGVTPVTYADEFTTIINFAGIVPGQNDEIAGILRVTYRAGILQQVITESIGTSTESSVLVLDQFNIRMVDTRYPENVLKSIVPLELVDYLSAVDSKRFLDIPREEQATNFPDFDLALDTASEQPFFRADITPDIPGDDTIAVAFLDNQPWVVAFSRPTSVFLADVQRQTQTNSFLVIGVSILVIIAATLIARTFTRPIVDLTKTADSIAQGDLNARAKIESTDEIGTLASTFNSMTDQLQSTLTGLEQRVMERTADFQKTALELQTIAEVAREIAIIRDLDTLLNVSTSLIRERLQYYHVGIFLVDENAEYAVLRAASSLAAEQMLEKNYKLKVGETGLVGNVTRTGQAYIALDAGTDAVHFENPYLPETRSEIALPLRIHSATFGALDIQANVPNAFGEGDIQTLQILADLLAATIENAQLVQKVEGTISELTKANRTQTQQVWQSTITDRGLPAYEYDGLQIRAMPQNLSPDLLKKLENGNPIAVQQEQNADNKNTLLVPLMVLNQVIGVIGLEQEDPTQTWTEEKIAIARAAANRAALTLENARLLEESQKRAVKERTIIEATSRIGSALSIENILQTTAEELERVLSGSEVIIQFTDNQKTKP
jgi:GAF domain-containing protein/HAMP domain-containing protein